MAAVAVIAVLAAACGQSAAPVANLTPTPTAAPSVAPSAGVCDATHRCLALVTLRGSDNTLVRDVSDIDHPATLGNLGMNPVARFVSADEVSYVGANGLVHAPLTGSPAASAGAGQDFVSSAFDWSPDGATLLYLTGDSTSLALHALTSGHDLVLSSSLPGMPAVGCETQFCAGLDTWDVTVAYARDGSAVSLIFSLPGRDVFRIWTAGAKVLDASDGKGRFMSVWSGASLYFRDATGVNVWSNGSVSTFLPGVAWIAPKASPAGGELVYATKDAQGWHHVFVANTSSRETREVKTERSAPTFLTSRYLWYRGERACVASDNCPSGWSVVDSGKTYIYDLQTGLEYESVITNVFDAWPHAA
jgi:hypothetical protein